MVLSVFVPSRKKVALSRFPDAFAEIDLTDLVGESINPEDLNDDLLGQFLDRIHEYGCSTLYRSISLTVRTTFDLPSNYSLIRTPHPMFLPVNMNVLHPRKSPQL